LQLNSQDLEEEAEVMCMLAVACCGSRVVPAAALNARRAIMVDYLMVRSPLKSHQGLPELQGAPHKVAVVVQLLLQPMPLPLKQHSQ
jgi:hypothetical protein